MRIQLKSLALLATFSFTLIPALPASAVLQNEKRCAITTPTTCLSLAYDRYGGIDYGDSYFRSAVASGKATATGVVRASIWLDHSTQIAVSPYLPVKKNSKITYSFGLNRYIAEHSYVCLQWEGTGVPIGEPCIGSPVGDIDEYRNSLTIKAPFSFGKWIYNITYDDRTDPQPSCLYPDYTVWARFTSPVTRYITVNTQGSSYGTQVAVYDSNFNEVACESFGDAVLNFVAQKGKIYYFLIDVQRSAAYVPISAY